MEARSNAIFGSQTSIVSPPGTVTTYDGLIAKYASLYGVESVDGRKTENHVQRYTKDTYEYPHGHMEVESQVFDVKSTQALSGILTSHGLAETFGISFSDEAREVALSRLLSKVKDCEANLAVDLAESGKTFDMINHRAQSIIGWARKARKDALGINIRRPFPKRERRWTKDFSNAWLEYSYGWKPLIMSMAECADFVGRHTVSFKVEGQKTLRTTPSVPLVFPEYRLVEPYPVKGKVTYKEKYSYILAVKDQQLHDLSRLTSLNPLTIAWELVPYSFVVDWFINIGGFLQNVETSLGAGLRVKAGYHTRVVYGDFQLNRVFLPTTVSGSETYRCKELSARRTFAMKERTPQSELPFPDFPSLEPKIGPNRLISAAALLRQLGMFRHARI